MAGGKIKMSQQKELDLLIQRRNELITYVINNDLTQEKHIMKFYELQDINLKIMKIKLDFKFENTIKKDWWKNDI